MDKIPLYVVGFCFSLDRSQILLIRKKRPSWQAGLLNGIGGHIEEGESSLNAMVREFKEETSVETKEEDWFKVANLYGSYFNLDCYFTNNDEYFNLAKTSTDEEIIKISVNDLFRDCFNSKEPRIVSNLTWLLALCLDVDIPRMCITVRYED